jgi:pyrroloquinoline quinone biosynthesis protein E
MKPRLSRKARVRPDPRDGTPVLLSPERGLRLSETAAAVVALCDGTRTLDEIVAELASRYTKAEHGRIEADVVALLADLNSRALIEGLDFHRKTRRREAEEETPQNLRAFASSCEFSPYTLVAELTHRCPLGCPYCSNPRELVRGQDELSTGDWLRVLDEAKALGAMQLHLTGGEPLARSDLETIARHARALDLYVNLVTSGIPLDRARLERLAPSLDHVQLSVQASDAATCDRIAGIESFDAKVRVARWVKELSLPLTLNCVLHRENLDRVQTVVELAEELGADRLELANVQMVSWAHDNAAALLPTRSQIENARSVAQAAKARLQGRMEVVFVLPDWHAGRPRACMDGWGRRFVVVAPDGFVLPCHAARALPLEFESVRGTSLARAWADAPGMQAFRGEAWMPEPCRTCDRRAIDFGGCRCQAFALTGDARATDPACALAPAHRIVLAAREQAELDTKRTWIYRGRGIGSLRQ